MKRFNRFGTRASFGLIAALTLMLGGEAFAGGSAPEIDPGMAVGGLTVFAVGVVLLIERYRARR